mmetsp:Transcript_4852/g.10433  ORF Transcript_4852/g.10433 Transcript_4852/m.10433 type:complete len:145 (+) Transcript_4852:841-1275(+)
MPLSFRERISSPFVAICDSTAEISSDLVSAAASLSAVLKRLADVLRESLSCGGRVVCDDGDRCAARREDDLENENAAVLVPAGRSAAKRNADAMILRRLADFDVVMKRYIDFLVASFRFGCGAWECLQRAARALDKSYSCRVIS